MICDFETATISQCLGTPVRQPDYRNNRSHDDFLTSIPTTIGQLRPAIAKAWQAEETVSEWPEELTQKLAEEKYRSEEWLRRVEYAFRSAKVAFFRGAKGDCLLSAQLLNDAV